MDIPVLCHQPDILVPGMCTADLGWDSRELGVYHTLELSVHFRPPAIQDTLLHAHMLSQDACSTSVGQSSHCLHAVILLRSFMILRLGPIVHHDNTTLQITL